MMFLPKIAERAGVGLGVLALEVIERALLSSRSWLVREIGIALARRR